MILTQIPPEHEHLIPHRAVFDIMEAMQHSHGERKLKDVVDAIHNGSNQIWVQWDDHDNHIGTVVTQICYFDQKKACVIEYCGGISGEGKDYYDNISTIEDWARYNGCDELRVIGRDAWQRILQGYGFKKQYTVLGKDL